MTEIWGDLPESQISNRTVAQAIADYVNDHLNDPDAHLEIGQSLQSHKASEIIDHIAGSVVRDKLGFDRFQIDEHFSTIDAWEQSAGVSIPTISEMTLTTTSVINNVQYASINAGDSQVDAANISQNPICETRVSISNITNQQIYICQGFPSDGNGFGFKIVNSTVYAFWIDSDEVEHIQSVYTNAAYSFNRYRWELVYGYTLKFYINGALVHTVISPNLNTTSKFITYQIKATSAFWRSMSVQTLHFDADYSN